MEKRTRKTNIRPNRVNERCVGKDSQVRAVMEGQIDLREYD